LAETKAATSMPSTNWVAGINYARFSEEGADLQDELNSIGVSLGYDFLQFDRLHLIPELRIGIGVDKEDTRIIDGDFDVVADLDNYIAFSFRGQLELAYGVYVFAAPAYTNIGYTFFATQTGHSAASMEESWELGIGGGAGYRLLKRMSAEFMFEQFNDTDIATLGLKFNF